MVGPERKVGRAARLRLRKRIVVIDDSVTIRKWLRMVLESDPRLHVVGEAASAQAARAVIRETNPDAVTLDIEMPGMDGLAFLERLMSLRPLPVVMISGATQANSQATVTALSLGAVDCLLKPTTLPDQKTCRDITRRVFSAACSNVQIAQRPAGAVRAAAPKLNGPLPIVLVGASTGGVAALEVFLSSLPVDGPPVVAVQHMPGPFLVSFSQMLSRRLPQDVALARDGERVGRGQVRLAPAQGQHTTVHHDGAGWRCVLQETAGQPLHCPSVDVLFSSAVSAAQQVIAVILTGLGRDGASGMAALHAAGAITLGQDKASCVVYGMPRAAWKAGAVNRQVPLARLGSAVTEAVLDLSRRGG